MKKNLKVLAIVICTFLVLFATTFLLDLSLVKENLARQVLVWLLLAFQLVLGILLLGQEVKG